MVGLKSWGNLTNSAASILLRELATLHNKDGSHFQASVLHISYDMDLSTIPNVTLNPLYQNFNHGFEDVSKLQLICGYFETLYSVKVLFKNQCFVPRET